MTVWNTDNSRQGRRESRLDADAVSYANVQVFVRGSLMSDPRQLEEHIVRRETGEKRQTNTPDEERFPGVFQSQ